MIYIFLTCHIQSFRKSGLPSQNIQNSIISNDLDYQCLGPSCHHLSPELQETLKKSLSFNYWFSIVKNQWTLCASLLLPCSKWVFTTVPYNFLIIFCMFSISMISYDSFYIYINILSKLANDLSTILVIQWANFYFLFIKYIFEKMKSSHNFTFQRKITWICYHFSKYPFKCLLIRDALKIFHMKIELYSALLCNFKNV